MLPGGAAVERHVRRDHAGRARRPGADRRHRRRPAGGALRAGLHRARAWRRTPTARAASSCCTPASEPVALDARAAHHGRVRRARRPGLRARGRGLHRRRRDPVAARRARPAEGGGRVRAACAQRGRARSASTSCPAFVGLGAPVLGRRGARRRARPHPRRHAGPPRAGHARVARLPDPRRHGRHGRRRRRAACRRCASTAARRPTTS